MRPRVAVAAEAAQARADTEVAQARIEAEARVRILAETKEADKQQQQRTGGGVFDTVLELMVRVVLFGAQVLVVIAWFLGRVSLALEFVVELGLFILRSPPEGGAGPH